MEKKYILVQFDCTNEHTRELLIAEMNEVQYDGFEETNAQLSCFILQNQFKEATIQEIASRYQVSYTLKEIQEQNWNAVWESNFQPVIISDFVGIRADFHTSIQNVCHEIIITPKMSFGTGHHATTYMMIEHMKSIDFTNKSVLDFGTGTGILAILAEKLGAKNITAIDNDDWSIENAKENFEKNHCKVITLTKAEDLNHLSDFDIILANINKHVIEANIKAIMHKLKSGGNIILSGFLKEDEQDMITMLRPYNPHQLYIKYYDNWLLIYYT